MDIIEDSKYFKINLAFFFYFEKKNESTLLDVFNRSFLAAVECISGHSENKFILACSKKQNIISRKYSLQKIQHSFSYFLIYKLPLFKLVFYRQIRL